MSPTSLNRKALLSGITLIAAFLFTPNAPPAAAQEVGSVVGTVVDEASGRRLADAQVLVTGTGIGGLTNAAGFFRLGAVPVGSAEISVSLIGYQRTTQTVTVAPAGVSVEFRMSQTAISLGEIVVTGVGQATERRALGTTVDVISAAEIDQAPVQNVAQLLQGRVAGATVNATSSQPGTGSLINFRGVSSVVGAQTPVIYIDGVRVDNDQSTAAGTGGEQSSALADLMASDIERIEITKGGAASTLFGSDAATGVIQIFTKRGTPGAPKVTARIERAYEVPELKYMFDVGLTFPDLVAAGEAPATLLADQYWRNGQAQTYYVGVNGGTAAVTYRLSGRINQTDGTQPKNGSVQYNLSGGMQATISDRLRVEFSGAYTRSSFDRLFNGTAIADPITTFEVGDALFFSGESTLQGALEMFLRPDITEEVNRFLVSGGGHFNWNDDVETRFTVGVDARTNHQRVLQPIGFTPGEPTGSLTRFNREFTSVSLNLATTWRTRLNDGLSSALTFGAQGFRDDESVFNANGTGFALPGSEDFGSAAEVSAGEGNSELFNGGVFVDEQLAFQDKLFIGGGVRIDAGSSFGDEIAYQAYPKGTLSYVISEESFIPGGDILNELKLRGAYGRTGKFPGPFLRDRTFSAIPFRGESAPSFANPGNDELKPEVTSTIEYGFDAALLDNRIGVGFTYFDAVTSDALFLVPEQPSTGLGNQLRNVGEIANTGIEVALSATVLNIEDYVWSLSGTFNTVTNEVTDMGSAADFNIEAQKRVSEGKPVGTWWMTHPVDTNGDGLADGSETQFVTKEDGSYASPQPDQFGAFSTQLTLWNRLSLSALADWATGAYVFDYGSVWATFNAIYRREEIEGVTFPDRYDTSGTGIGKYSQSAARRAFLYEGDWLKLREVSARYELPESLVGDRAERASIYASVRNLAIWSSTAMVDPELSGVTGGGLELGGESSITASPNRAFRFGLEFVF